jgi:hypothetical protein
MVKSRKYDFDTQIGHYKTIPTSPGPVPIIGEDSIMRLGDWGHYGYPDFPTDRDIGGKFFLSKYNYSRGVANLGTIRSGSSRYIGGVAALAPSISKYTNTSWTPDANDCYNAYNRMKPAKSDFEGLNAIFELKDLPGMLRQRLSHNGLKDVGNYYLAEKFGWVPLLKDIRKLVHVQRNMTKRINQLLRDNGRPVRRRISLRSDSNTVTNYGQSYASFAPGLSTGFYQGFTPIWKQDITTSERIWASAQFRYWLPDGPRDIVWTNRMKSRILGSNTPSPKDVWNAMPWTWLTDWFVDVGGMLESMDTDIADRVAADYIYIMRELQVAASRECIGYFRHDAGDYFYASATSHATATIKCRDRGTPFGWNVSAGSLSLTQWSILGALGLSKL